MTDASVITPRQLSSILSQLPAESGETRDTPALPVRQRQPSPAQVAPEPIPEPVQAQPPPGPPPAAYSPPPSAPTPSYNEKAAPPGQYAPPPQPPPAYPQVPPILGLATALYAYTPTDAGDLALQPHDRIQVVEHMNDDCMYRTNPGTRSIH